MTSNLSNQAIRLFLLDDFFPEHLASLCEHDVRQALDDVLAHICRGGVEEVFVYVGQHAGCLAIGEVGAFEAVRITGQPSLVGCERRERRGNLKDDACLFVRQARLGDGLLCEGILPRSRDAELGKAKFEHLEHVEPFEEEVSGCGASRASAECSS